MNDSNDLVVLAARVAESNAVDPVLRAVLARIGATASDRGQPELVESPHRHFEPPHRKVRRAFGERTGCPPATPTDLGWAAGFLDGEGCLHIAKQVYTDPRRRPSFGFRISIAQSDYEVLDHFREVLGVHGRIHRLKRKGGMNRQPYALHYSGPHAFEVVRRLQPYMVAKRIQADTALEFEIVARPGLHSGPRGHPPELWKLRESYYRKMQRLK